MYSSDGLVVIVAAVGAVIFLFVTDHLFRLQEARVENALAEKETQEERSPGYVELPEERDEPNVAA